MDFGEALRAMQNGRAVALPHWKPDVTIRFQTPDAHSKMTHPYCYAQSRFGLVPWIPTWPEMLSQKWMTRDSASEPPDIYAPV